MISLYPFPEGEPVYEGYQVIVNGAEVKPYVCRVSAMPFNCTWPGRQRPLDQTELAAFLSFGLSGQGEPAYVQINAGRPVGRAVVRPLSRKIRANVQPDGCVCFTIREPGQYTVELDGHHHAMHLFVNPIRDDGIAPDAPHVRYFGPGIHRPGPIQLMSGETIYLAEGAVVHTTIRGENVSNVRIMGRGVLDNSEYERNTYTCFGCPAAVMLHECENVLIQDVVMKDSCSWTITAWHSRNISIRNVKAVGMWRYNSDGFDMVNCSNVLIRDCFLRNFDDCVVLKGYPPYEHANLENIRVAGCVVWCDWGRGLEIGAETCADEYRNIVFEDCDLIHSTHIAIDIQNSGTALVHGLRFENIRVEYEKDCQEPIYQKSMDMEYHPKPEPHMPYLILAEVHAYYHDWLLPDEPNGRNEDIYYKNIQVFAEDGLPMPPSCFRGLDEACCTRGMHIDGLFLNGRRMTDLSEANIQIGRFASQVDLK